MKKGQVSVVFDRKYRVKKDTDGVGSVDVFVNISRTERKYITVGKCKRSDFDEFQHRKDVALVVRRCKEVLAALPVLNLTISVENFNSYYNDKEKAGSDKANGVVNLYNGVDQNSDFIAYMQQCVDEEQISKGTRKYKLCTISALKRFGQIKTFADLTPGKIMQFDKWLHDGTRKDVSIYTYHKNVRKVVRRLFMMEMIPSNPYAHVTIKRGICKERKPLTEEELIKIRTLSLSGKLARVRDLLSSVPTRVFPIATSWISTSRYMPSRRATSSI